MFYDYSMMVTFNKIGEKQFRLLSRNGFHVKIKECKIYCCGLALWSEPQIWISRGRLVEYSKILHQKAWHTCCTTVFPHSTNHNIDLWRCFCDLKHCVTSYMHWLCVASRTSLAYFPLSRISRLSFEASADRYCYTCEAQTHSAF